MVATKIFLTGATGYIGGSFLAFLLKFPEKYSVSALVRNKDQEKVLQQLGVTPVFGSLDDYDTIFQASKAADVVISTAHADHLPSVQAMVNGLKAKNDKNAVFLHTSGTGVLTYEPSTEVHFDDEDISRIHSIPIHALHKDVDSWIFQNEDGIRTAIIAPSTINGINPASPFNKKSIQVITLIKASVARGKVGYFDRKDVTWGNVNILDLVDLYQLVLEGLLRGDIGHNKEGGWYFGTAQDHIWYKLSERLAEVLHKHGLVESTEVTKFDEKDLELYFPQGPYGMNRDSKSIANRSRKIGWKPSRPNVFETLEEEVQFLLATGEIQKKK